MELIATAESVDQAKALVDAGIHTLYIGEDTFGLRLPTSFSREDIQEITQYAHAQQKYVCVAVNAIMHNDRIKKVQDYLAFLENIGVDAITVGDPGVIHLLQKNQMTLPYIYDAQTLVTSANQINFWAKRGATGAVLARELTYEELTLIGEQATVPVEMLVYGATCIHQSKRPVVGNYFNFIENEKPEEKQLYLSEPKKPESHYPIYEDINGTHIFASNDINLMPFLDQLAESGLKRWKLDGLFTRGDQFVEIARLFVEAADMIDKGMWTAEKMEALNAQLVALHPTERGLDEGFFLKDPADVK
ncbi:peptidase U32 family protein [Lentibacillus saliphilus]|uniref:peptidase U32 family protein n=1 Tax=Lentibacillus saliphilus TaxID=2737028 RepID=UPI0031BA8D01